MQQQSFESETQSSDGVNNESFIEERKEMLEDLFERVESYVQVNIQLYKLRAIELVAETTSSVVSNILIVIIAILFFLFANIGVAIWLGSVLSVPSGGYFIVAGFYLLVLIILYSMRKNMFKKSIGEAIRDQFTKD